MEQIALILKEWLKYLSPLAIIIFAILTTGGILKWFGMTKNAVKEIMKSPTGIVIVLAIAGALFYFYFAFLAPLLEI